MHSKIRSSQWNVKGVDKESRFETDLLVNAETEAAAKIKVELQGVVVTSVEAVVPEGERQHGKDAEPEQTLYRARPVMFKNRPIVFVLLCLYSIWSISILLSPADPLLPPVLSLYRYGFIVGAIVCWLRWFFNCLGTTLTVTTVRSILRKGILSKHISEVWHRHVRNVQVKQGMLQRVFNVGSIGISSAGQSDIEIMVSGLVDPYKAKGVVDDHRP